MIERTKLNNDLKTVLDQPIDGQLSKETTASTHLSQAEPANKEPTTVSGGSSQEVTPVISRWR